MPESEWIGMRRLGVCLIDIDGLHEAINMYRLSKNIYMKMPPPRMFDATLVAFVSNRGLEQDAASKSSKSASLSI